MYTNRQTAQTALPPSVGANVIGSSGGPQAQAEIAACLDGQEKATHALLECIDLLESRLMPVLQPAPPATGPVPTPTSAVPVAACIMENTQRIQVAMQRLEDIRLRTAL